MKTSKIILQADKNNIEASQKKAKAGKGLNYLFFFFMLSWIAFLPSCAVEVRTPQPGITIESHQHGFRHHHEYRRAPTKSTVTAMIAMTTMIIIGKYL